jgi:hypothetical protein
MNSQLWVFALLLVAPLCRAQNYASWELYGGYQATRADVSELQNAAPDLPIGNGIWMNGGSLSVAQYKTPWFAGAIDLTAVKGRKSISFPAGSSTTLFSVRANPAIYTLTGGPQFHFKNFRQIHPLARVLFGAARVNLSLDPTLEQVFKDESMRSIQTSFAVQTGAGIDCDLTPHFGLRTTTEYLGTWFYSHQQSNVLISSGAILRWGL